MGNEAEYIKFFASLGVGGVLAGMMFYFYRSDALKHKQDIKDHTTECKLREDKLIEVLIRTAIGHEKLCNSINELSASLKKTEEARLHQLLPILEKIISKND